MKVFCSNCGAPQEVDAQRARGPITCTVCGSRFTLAGAFPPGAPPPDTGAPAPKKSRVLTFVLIGLGLVFFCPCLGIVTAIAIPNFIKFQARSKQGECKAHLKSWFTLERAYMNDHRKYSPFVHEVGFNPEPGNRYAYLAAAEGLLEDRSRPAPVTHAQDIGIDVDLSRHPLAAPYRNTRLPELEGGVSPGITGTCPDCDITLVCIGNIDGDPDLDVWSISTRDRTARDGTPIPSGIPYNDVNDLTTP